MANTEVARARSTSPACTGSRNHRLTGSRLEKKRLADREAQRAARLKTKSYVAHLERLVETLSQNAQDGQVADLTAHLDKAHSENGRLRDALRGIYKGAQLAIEGEKEKPRDEGPIPAAATSFSPVIPPALTSGPDTNGDNHPMHHSAVPGPTASDNDGHVSFTKDAEPSLVDLLCLGGEYSNINPTLGPVSPTCLGSTQGQNCMQDNSFPDLHLTNIPLSLHDVSSVPAPSIPSDVPIEPPTATFLPAKRKQYSQESNWVRCMSDDSKLFQFAMETLSSILKLCKSDLLCSREQDDDITIRAVFHGWKVIDSTLDLGWRCLRQVDERLFSLLGQVERVAMLRLMRLELRVSSQDVPAVLLYKRNEDTNYEPCLASS